MTIRLAFCGASGTGKSTLASLVSARIGLPICPVGSREVSKAMGFASPYDVDAAGKRVEFQHELLKQKYAWERSHADGYVSDRTHFDNLTYTTMHAPGPAADPHFIEAVVAAASYHTHIVLCPIGAVHNVGDDPARINDSRYHREYERILLDLILEYATPVPVLILTSSQRDVRLRHVLDFVSP